MFTVGRGSALRLLMQAGRQLAADAAAVADNLEWLEACQQSTDL